MSYYNNGDKYDTLDSALNNLKVNKFEYGKYTIYSMKNPPKTSWYGVTITEKQFVKFKSGVEIKEVEILPEQIPPMDWAYLTFALLKDDSWQKKNFWEEQCRVQWVTKFSEGFAQEAERKGNILRMAFGADTICLDNLPIRIAEPEAYESWMLRRREDSERMPTTEEKENLKKRIPWLYKMFYGDPPSKSMARIAGL